MSRIRQDPGTGCPLAEDLLLADGAAIRIRPIGPEDRHRHWRFVCSLSLQSRYHRLLSARGLLPGELRRMVEIDYEREMALVAVARLGDEDHELGVARYVRDDAQSDEQNRRGAGAEFAIVVADAWQRRGIGQLLLRRLMRAASSAGISQLAGITLATNVKMIRLARRLGFEVSREPGDWTVKRITWRQVAEDEAWVENAYPERGASATAASIADQ